MENLQFRAEIFNIFNRANFDIPQNIVNASSFGQIFNTVQPVAGLASGGPGEPRELPGLRQSPPTDRKQSRVNRCWLF
jgi:hypothetical protein